MLDYFVEFLQYVILFSSVYRIYYSFDGSMLLLSLSFLFYSFDTSIYCTLLALTYCNIFVKCHVPFKINKEVKNSKDSVHNKPNIGIRHTTTDK